MPCKKCKKLEYKIDKVMHVLKEYDLFNEYEFVYSLVKLCDEKGLFELGKEKELQEFLDKEI